MNYEKELVYENEAVKTQRELAYIESPTGLVAIVEKKNEVFTIYYTYTNYLGSILTITNSSGTIVEERDFDAWGRIRYPHTLTHIEDIEYRFGITDRGFTGHEHLYEFRLINMNGRMYDPVLARFLSPDNYIQDATSTQSYNRFAYVWNNPLKYTDPEGEFVIITAIAAGAVLGYINGKNAGLNGWDLAGYTFAGAVIGGLSAGVGTAVSASVSSAFGVGANAITVGAISGAVGGFVGGYIGGFGSSVLNGSTDPFNSGLKSAAIGGIFGGILGGIGGGFKNLSDGKNFSRTKYSGSGSPLAYGYAVDASTGKITKLLGSHGEIGGANTHIYNVGNWSEGGTAFTAYAQFIVDGANTINTFRIWESAFSTISAFSAPISGLTGYFLEPSGPSTTIPNLDKRVPSGYYNLFPNTASYPGNFMIYNKNVALSRGITIHSGNYPENTKGCLLPGKYWRGGDFVESSRDMLDSLNLMINKINYKNVQFNIFDSFK